MAKIWPAIVFTILLTGCLGASNPAAPDSTSPSSSPAGSSEQTVLDPGSLVGVGAFTVSDAELDALIACAKQVPSGVKVAEVLQIYKTTLPGAKRDAAFKYGMDALVKHLKCE